jgi:hypothetical protein
MNERYDLNDTMKQVRELYDDLEDMILYYDSAMSDVAKAHTSFRIADMANDLREHILLLQHRAYTNGRYIIHDAHNKLTDDHK